MASILTLILIVPAVLYAIYVLAFFFNYKKIQQLYAKWSNGTYMAPDKRFNKQLLYGLLIIGILCGVPFVADCATEYYLETAGYKNGWEIVGTEYVQGNLQMFNTYIARRSSIHSWLWLADIAVIAAILIPTLAFLQRKNGLDTRNFRFELLYGTLGFGAWLAAVAVIVCGFIFATAILIAAVCLYLVGIIIHFCFAKEITVKKPGFLGGTKKIWATRNPDGTYSDISGNKYKPKD